MVPHSSDPSIPQSQCMPFYGCRAVMTILYVSKSLHVFIAEDAAVMHAMKERRKEGILQSSQHLKLTETAKELIEEKMHSDNE